jgi:hypothetical protein
MSARLGVRRAAVVRRRRSAARWVAGLVCVSAGFACASVPPAPPRGTPTLEPAPEPGTSASAEPIEPPPPPDGVAPGALAALPTTPALPVARRTLSSGLALFAQPLAAQPSPTGAKTRELRAGRLVFVLEIEGLAASADGERTGLARLAAEAWFEEHVARESLHARGGDAWLWHGFDAVRLVVAVPPAGLEATLTELRGALDRRAFSAPAFARALVAERARLSARLAADDAFVAEQVLHERLFQLPVSLHPFASLAPTEAELERLTSAATEGAALLRANLVDGKMRLVLLTPTPSGGGVTARELDAALERVGRALTPAPGRGLRGAAQPEASSLPPLTTPFPPGDLRIALVERPSNDARGVASAVVTLRLAFGGLPRSSLAFGSWLVAAPLLEAALRADPRVGPSARVGIRLDVPRGAVPLEIAFTAAGTAVGPALVAAQEVIARVAGATPSAADLAAAKRRALFTLAEPASSPDGVAPPPLAGPAFRLLDELAEAAEAEPDELRKRVVAVQPAGLSADLTPLFDVPPVLVAVGDARLQADALAQVADVDVLDPKRNFARIRSVLRKAKP